MFGHNFSYVESQEVLPAVEHGLQSSQAEDVQAAFQLDSLRASHPIEVPVRVALYIRQMFDPISYHKGSSVICMLSAHLGVRVFLQGVSKYSKAYAYSELPSLFWNRSKIGLLTLEGQCNYVVDSAGY